MQEINRKKIMNNKLTLKLEFFHETERMREREKKLILN
jgi:hypothetical protein